MKVREGRESGNTEVRIESAIAVRSSSLQFGGGCECEDDECCKGGLVFLENLGML